MQLQVNISTPDPLGKNPVDNWHWDSVAYTGVILLNNMDDFEGVEFKFMMME